MFGLQNVGYLRRASGGATGPAEGAAGMSAGPGRRSACARRERGQGGRACRLISSVSVWSKQGLA